MNVPANILRRLEALEAIVARQRAVLAGVLGRPPRATGTRWAHLAKTIRVGGAYPAAGNTFGLQFIDREFTPSEGIQAATDHTRSATSQAVGRTLDGEFLSEGTVVVAIPAPAPAGTTGKGRWHILPLTPSEIFLGQADGALASNTSGPVKRFLGGAETDTLTVDTVVNKWPTIANGGWVIYGDINGTLYVLAPSGGGATTGVPFWNNSGEEIPACSVMKPVREIDIGGNLYIEVAKPDTTFDQLYLVNGGAAVPDTSTSTDGAWLLDGYGPVAVDQSAALVADFQRELGPMPGSWVLWPYRQGFFGTGPSYTDGVAVVDCIQRRVDEVFGKLVEDLDMAGHPAGDISAQFEIWYRGEDRKLRATGYRIDVYPFFLNKNEKIKTGTKGKAHFASDYWEGDFACDPDDTDAAQQSPAANLDQSFIFQGPATTNSTQFAAGAGSLGTGTGGK